MRNRVPRMMFPLLIVIGIMVFISGNSYAELKNPDLPDRDGIKVADKAILHSAFRTDEILETNIYLNNTDRKFDAITLLNPSVGIEVPFYENKFSADYDVGIFLYGQYNTENHIDQKVRGLAEFNFYRDYILSLIDTFRIFTDRAADEDSRRIGRKVNDFRVGVAKEYEKLGFDIGYTNKVEVYGSSDDLIYQSITYKDRDRMSNLFDGTLSYRFLPKTYALFENDFGLISYYNCGEVPGSWFYEGLAGIKGEWFSRADVNFKVGFRCQQYDSSVIYADKNYIGPVFRGGFNYYPTDIDTVTVGLEKTVFESTYSNMNYYDVNLFDVKYKHSFTDKVSAGASGSYQLSLYPTKTTQNGLDAKRQDNLFRAGAFARYDIRKWVSVEARYEYKQRTSKFDIFDYVDNLVTFRGTVGF